MRISDWSSDVCSSDLVFDGVEDVVEPRLGQPLVLGDEVADPGRRGVETVAGEDLAPHLGHADQQDGEQRDRERRLDRSHAPLAETPRPKPANETPEGWEESRTQTGEGTRGGDRV